MSLNNIKRLFPEFYQEKITPNDFKNHSNNLIVVDTNYLLDILRHPLEIANRYVDALEQVQNNLYVPYLVALEFNFQKSSIKKERKRLIENYNNEIDKKIDALKTHINSHNQFKFNDKTDKLFSESITEKIDEFSKHIKSEIDENIKKFITDGEREVYDRLISIIENRVGKKYSQDWILEVEKEGLTRYENKIPPGFDDSGKSEENSEVRRYSDLEYQIKFGDLIIWKDIIEKSRDNSSVGNKLIFVTNDGTSEKKNDLLYKVKGMTVGPNISMMNELFQESQKQFYIVNNLRFVSQAQDLNIVQSQKLEDDLDKTLKKYNLDLLNQRSEKITEYDEKLFEKQIENEESYKNHIKEFNKLLLDKNYISDYELDAQDFRNYNYIKNITPESIDKSNYEKIIHLTSIEKIRLKNYSRHFKQFPNRHIVEDLLDRSITFEEYYSILDFLENEIQL